MVSGEFGKSGGVCHCHHRTELSVVAMATLCLLYTELSRGLPSALLPLGVWGFSSTLGLTVGEAGGSALASSC